MGDMDHLRVLAERDAAVAEVEKVSRQLGYCEVERDVALGRVKELEEVIDHNRTRANVTFMAQTKRIAQLEAECAEVRKTALEECAQHMARNFCEKCAYENNQWLRAALEGK